MQALRMIISSWWEDKTNRLISLVALLLIFFGIFSSQPKIESSDTIETADTVIPAGHVLMPIEIANLESLDSIFGAYGVVDLFSTNNVSGKKSSLISANIKLLRAPLDPKQFAILVPEDLSTKILEYEGPYFVVVKNPKHQTMKKIEPKKKSRVEYLN